LKQLVEGLQRHTDEIRARLGDLLLPDVPLLPVPFFGNIEAARVLTIGLNPAITEFAPHRDWAPLDARNLAFRLVNYFRLAGIRYPPPHSWFSEIIEFLYIAGCPHRIGFAHVDLCPWTSVAPVGLNGERKERFWNLVNEEMETWFGQIIAYSKQTVKLVVFLQPPNHNPQGQERRMRAEQILRDALVPVEIRVETKRKNELVGWAWEEKAALREYIGLSNICD
jgi:hypothetical protein